MAALTLALIPAAALADKKIEDIPKADPKAPLSSWTPVQQWREGEGTTGNNPIPFSLMADELGSRLSELGRARVIQHCLRHKEQFAEGALAWTVCRDDVRRLDLKKLEAELTAEGITGAAKTDVLDNVKDIVTTAKLTGDPIEALAKNDSGVQQILRLGDSARAEWTAYEAKNKVAVDRYLALKDAVRSARGNDKAFTGCYEATQPAFAKVVKASASKIPYDTSADAMDGYTGGYLSFMPPTADTYISSVSYAACLWSIHESARHFYRVAASAAGGRAIAGPRMLAVAKLLDESFKPKFDDRSLGFRQPNDWKAGPSISAPGQYDKDLVNGEAVIAKLTPAGELTKFTFKGETIERCIQYANDAAKTCLKRGILPNELGEGVAPTKFLSGVKPGLSVALKFGFPEVVWNAKTKTLTTILTIPVN